MDVFLPKSNAGFKVIKIRELLASHQQINRKTIGKRELLPSMTMD